MVTRVDRSEIIEMITRAAARYGMSLERFYDLGRANDLDEPSLRDLWLIWGDVLKENDVRQPA